MAIPRKKILEKIAGKQKGIDYHLDVHIPGLIGNADKRLVEYWRKEVHRLIDEMEGWGGRLSDNDDAISQAARYRERLEGILSTSDQVFGFNRNTVQRSHKSRPLLELEFFKTKP